MSDDTSESTGASALSRPGLPMGAPAPARRARLADVYREARECTKCPQLVAGRTQVVFGAGNADAELMFIGEAPGAREDERGVPSIGASGRLLDELLASIGLQRADVFVTNVLKCRPPGNRDPAPAEIARCRPYLHEQIALIEPRVVCTLGNFATKLLREDPAGIKDLHGEAQVVQVGQRAVHLLPLYHPAAALYTRSLLDTLRQDFSRLPELLARPTPLQPEPELELEPESTEAPVPEISDEPVPEVGSDAHDAPREQPNEPEAPAPERPQLGLF